MTALRAFGLRLRHRDVADLALRELREAGFLSVTEELEATGRPGTTTAFGGSGMVLDWELSGELTRGLVPPDAEQAGAELIKVSIVVEEAGAQTACALLDKYRVFDALSDIKEGVHHAEHWGWSRA